MTITVPSDSKRNFWNRIGPEQFTRRGQYKPLFKVIQKKKKKCIISSTSRCYDGVQRRPDNIK